MFYLRVLSCAFTLHCDDATSKDINMQRALMQSVFAARMKSSAGSAETFRKIIAVQSATANDPCTWSGMQCTDGILTSVLMSHERIFIYGNDLHIDMDFFPNTVQFLYLKSVKYVDGWTADRLPRDLKFFCASQCVNAHDKTSSREIHMDRLPRQMEEIHLSSGEFAPISGVLLIANLPPNLRICHIRSQFLRKVLVDNLSIPDGIEMLNIYGNGQKILIKEASGKKLSRCVTNNNYLLGRGSVYFADLAQQAIAAGKEAIEGN